MTGPTRANWFPKRYPRRPRRMRRGRRGAVLVEFGVVLPVLVLIVLGCVDFGRFAYTHIAVTNSARAGAGLGSFNPVTSTTLPTWQALIEGASLRELAQLGSATDVANNATVAVTVITQNNRNDRVRVEVSYPFETLVTWPGIPDGVTITRAVEMRFIR